MVILGKVCVSSVVAEFYLLPSCRTSQWLQKRAVPPGTWCRILETISKYLLLLREVAKRSL